MREFFQNGRIINGLNPSFISLIPKKSNPMTIEDYLPISLIGGAYKILSKVLANRLSKVIDTVIGDNQLTFISGRNIMDGVIILNEALDEAKKKKKSRGFSSRWTSPKHIIQLIGSF